MQQKPTLRRLREDRGVSREALAVAVRTTFSTIVRIELGQSQPRLDLAIDLAKYFGVPVEGIAWPESRPKKLAA